MSRFAFRRAFAVSGLVKRRREGPKAAGSFRLKQNNRRVRGRVYLRASGSRRGWTLLAAAVLGLLTVGVIPASAEPPTAHFTADLTEDWIHGSGFAPNSPVTVQIGPASWTSETDGNGFFSLELWEWNGQGNLPLDVAPGLFVSVSDGLGTTKTLTTADLQITSFDTSVNTISGTTNMPADHLAVGAQHTNYGDQAIVSMPAPGSPWTADFDSAFTGPYQLRILDEASAWQTDADGDLTEVHRQLSVPRFSFSPELQEVVGYDWPAGATVTLTVNRNEGTAEYSANRTVGGECDSRDTCQSEYMPTGNGNVWFGFVGGSFLARPGDVMTMTDGATTKVETIPDLRLDVEDASGDTVSGTTEMPLPVGSFLVTHSEYPWSNGGVHHDVVPASDGSWQTSYAGETEVDGSAAVQFDEDGDATAVNAPRPDVRVDPAADRVWATDFTSTPVMLSIERDGSTFERSVSPTNVLTRGSWNLDMWTEPTDFLPRPAVALYDLAGAWDILAGDQVTVTDGVTTISFAVAQLTVDSVDQATNIVSGTAIEPVSLHFGDGEGGFWGYQATPVEGHWSYLFDPDEFPFQGLIPGAPMQAIVGQTVVRFTVPDSGYQFSGFSEPIDMDSTNIAKAGRSVPVKWRLTDFSGAPVTDEASIVGLFSYTVSCGDLTGDPSDAIEEYASGRSGLQNLGNGYWQYNWSTPKAYANSCRAMYVSFSDGTTSPVVHFTFTR
jgi:hypothetical protein